MDAAQDSAERKKRKKLFFICIDNQIEIIVEIIQTKVSWAMNKKWWTKTESTLIRNFLQRE